MTAGHKNKFAFVYGMHWPEWRSEKRNGFELELMVYVDFIALCMLSCDLPFSVCQLICRMHLARADKGRSGEKKTN